MNMIVSIWHMRKSNSHLFFLVFSGRMCYAFEMFNSHSRSAKYACTNWYNATSNSLFFLSCECNSQTTGTQICIRWRNIPLLQCFRYRAAFGSPQNALSKRTSTLGGFGLSSRHIRSITKKAFILPHLGFEKCVATMQKLQFQV